MAIDNHIKKWCCKCSRFLDKSEFNMNRTRKDKLQRTCRECAQATYKIQKAHYEKEIDRYNNMRHVPLALPATRKEALKALKNSPFPTNFGICHEVWKDEHARIDKTIRGIRGDASCTQYKPTMK